VSKEEEDPDIAIIKARKMKELREQATALENARIKKQQQEQTLRPKKTDREIISSYLYDRGEEVLNLAESQFPLQTKSIVSGLVELIKVGELKQNISGGELLALFRSVGIKVKITVS
jgi:DNA-binding TFAR19-related protein (PDSD5 family)